MARRTQRSQSKAMTKPRIYSEYLSSSLWEVIDGALKELEENSDIEITTDRYLVIGYLTKQIQQQSAVA